MLINDLDVDNLANVCKYVDDTNASHFGCPYARSPGHNGCAQETARMVAEWSTHNRVQLNSDKCRELRISFVKDEPQFAPIVIDGNELERVFTEC